MLASFFAIDTFWRVTLQLARDSTSKRGYAQRALVLLTRYPFVALNKRVAELVGRAFYGEEDGTSGDMSLLESAWRELCLWPAPHWSVCCFRILKWCYAILLHTTNCTFDSSASYELPLLGHVLLFRAPPARGLAHIFDSADTSDGLRVASPRVALGCASRVSNLDDVNVYAAFNGITDQLWLLWELVLTAEPLLVYGSTPTHASDAVFAALSLIAPLEYGGDIQPFYTVQEETFSAYSIDVKGAPLPAAIVGSCKAHLFVFVFFFFFFFFFFLLTFLFVSFWRYFLTRIASLSANPFFFRAFAHWPNVLSVGELSNDGVPQLSRRNTTKGLTQARKPSSNRARAMAGREVQCFSQTLVTPRTPIVRPSSAVLGQLFDPSQARQSAPLSRVASSELSTSVAANSSRGTSPSVGGADSASASQATPSTWTSMVDSFSSSVSKVMSTKIVINRSNSKSRQGDKAARRKGFSFSISIGVDDDDSDDDNDDNDDDDGNDNNGKAAADRDDSNQVADSQPLTGGQSGNSNANASSSSQVDKDSIVAESKRADGTAAPLPDAGSSQQADDADMTALPPQEASAHNVPEPASDSSAADAEVAALLAGGPNTPSKQSSDKLSERITGIGSPPPEQDSAAAGSSERWSRAALTAGLKSLADAAAESSRAVAASLWPEPKESIEAHKLVTFNNAVLRRHFFELTETFLAALESHFLTLLPAKPEGSIRPFGEKEFLDNGIDHSFSFFFFFFFFFFFLVLMYDFMNSV